MSNSHPSIPEAFNSEDAVQSVLSWNEDPPPYDTFKYEVESLLAGESAKVVAILHTS